MKSWYLATTAVIVGITAIVFQNCAPNAHQMLNDQAASGSSTEKSSTDQVQSVQFGDFANAQTFTLDLSTGNGEFQDARQAASGAPVGKNPFCVSEEILDQISAFRPFRTAHYGGDCSGGVAAQSYIFPYAILNEVSQSRGITLGESLDRCSGTTDLYDASQGSPNHVSNGDRFKQVLQSIITQYQAGTLACP